MHEALSEFDSRRRTRLRRNLLAWYAKHARKLPWRETAEPYHVWISEIMLQQTTVPVVVDYFRRFIARFPTVVALADAPLDEVLRLWEGLGYYSRARNLHKAAAVVVSEYNGRLPDDLPALMRLPGVGRYTAGAILSLAFNKPAPILEANTQRLYCRLLAYDGDPRTKEGRSLLWDFAAHIQPRNEPARFNQALMELGATICTPHAPACHACPARSACRAFAAGMQNEIPVRASRPEVTRLTEAAVAVCDKNRWLVRRCGPGERWAGLWDFPRFSLDDAVVKEVDGPRSSNGTPHKAKGSGSSQPKLHHELAGKLLEQTGVSARIGELAAQWQHTVTRYRIRLLVFVAQREGAGKGKRKAPPRGVNSSESAATSDVLRWVDQDELHALPLSATGRKIAQLLAARNESSRS